MSTEKTPLDRNTLLALRAEAAQQRMRYKKRFSKHDNTDDLNELNAWEHVVDWLNEKLAALET